MDVVRQFLLMAAGLVLTVSLIVVGYRIFDGAMLIGNRVVYSEQEALQKMEEKEINLYEGLEITGTKVINYVEKMYEKYGFDVEITNSQGVFHMSQLNSLNDLRNATGSYYLSPVKKYRVYVSKDNNGAAEEIFVTVIN